MKRLFSFLLLLGTGFSATAQNCVVNAGVSQTVCVGTTVTLTGASNGLFNGTPAYTWTMVSGPGAAIAAPSALVTTAGNLSVGTYIFKLSAPCQDAMVAEDTVTVNVIPQPTQAVAGADVSACAQGIFTLAANAPGAGETGAWMVVSSGATASFANAASPTTTVTAADGTRGLVWRISNGVCATTDTMVLKVTGGATTVSAGPDRTVTCSGTTVTLSGSNPGNAPQTGYWTLVSGPGVPIITAPAQQVTTVTNMSLGTYTFRWTVAGPCANGSDDVVITMANLAAGPSAGADVDYATFCKTGAPDTMLLSSSNPLPQGQMAMWSQVSGPVANILTPAQYATLVTPLNEDSNYVFRYVVSNGGCADTALHNIYFTPQIGSLSNPPDQHLGCDATSTQIQFTHTYATPGATSYTIPGLTRNGVQVSGPVGASIIQAHSPIGADNWNITGLTMAGTYVFRFEYRNACGAQFRDVAVHVSRKPMAANAGSAVVLACNVFTTALVGNTPPAGNTGTWSQVNGPTTATISSSAAPQTGIGNLAAGLYTFRWTIAAGAACGPSSDVTTVTVASPTVAPAAAGADATVCNSFPIQLAGNAPGLTQTVSWRAIPSAGLTFSAQSSPSTQVFGAAPGTVYQFIYTIQNACDTSRDTVVITTDNKPSQVVVDGGADQCVGSGLSATLTGTTATGASYTWTALNGGTLSSPSSNSTTVTVPQNGTYRFVYTLDISGCGSRTDTVRLTFSPPVTVAAAGPDQTICATVLPATITLSGNAASVGTPLWTLVGGNAGPAIQLPGSASTAVTNVGAGIYTFRYAISNGVCPSTSDSVNVNVGTSPSAANAGADMSVCNFTNSSAIVLGAAAPTVGTGAWTIVSGPAGSTPTIAPVTSPAANVINLSTGTYVLRWTTMNGSACPASKDSMTLTVQTHASNTPAGPGNLCGATVQNLVGAPGSTGVWTVASHPAGTAAPVITATGASTAVMSGLVAPGSYQVTYTIPAAGGCAATSVTRAFVNNLPPSTALAGNDTVLCAGVSSITLTGNTPTVGAGSWTWNTAPAAPTAGAANTNKADTTFTGLVPGVYVFRYNISNGGPACPVSTDSAYVIIEKAAAAGSDMALCNAASTLLSANTPAIYPAHWSQVSGPTTAVIANSAAPATNVTGLTAGSYAFRWTINTPSPCGPTSDTVLMVIDTLAARAFAGPDVAVCDGQDPVTIGIPAIPSVTYAWSTGSGMSSTAIAQPQFGGTPGTYTKTVSVTRGGCAVNDEVVVVVKPTPGAAFSVTPGCGAGFLATNAGAGASYAWAFGAGASPSSLTTSTPSVTNVSYSSSGSKTATLTVTAANGCAASAQQTFTQPNCTPLSLLLTDFRAEWIGNATATLHWTVSDNGRTDATYGVQRSTDGATFTDIGRLDHNATEGTARYQYTDRAAASETGSLYYRLAIRAASGAETFSAVRVLTVSSETAAATVSPNPFVDALTVRMPAGLTGAATVRVFSATGSLVYSRAIADAAAVPVITLGSREIPAPGAYLVQVNTAGGTQHFKVTKL